MDSNSFIHVAGFVDIYNYPKVDSSLILNSSIIKRYLPLQQCIPLNVEHLENGVIGTVWGLYLLKQGLFSVSVITSHDFCTLLETLYSDSISAQNKLNALPSNPRLEMLHAWLPELSLASVDPSAVSDTTDKFFHHIAICALGRRRGTTAVYGDSLSWVLEKFSCLEKNTKDEILAKYATKIPEIEKLSPETFCPPYKLLMAKAIDASFLKDRLDTLKIDKNVACVTSDTYLKASSLPKSEHLPEGESTNKPVPIYEQNCNEETQTRILTVNQERQHSFEDQTLKDIHCNKTTSQNNTVQENTLKKMDDNEKTISIPQQTLLTLIQKNMELAKPQTLHNNSIHNNMPQPDLYQRHITVPPYPYQQMYIHDKVWNPDISGMPSHHIQCNNDHQNLIYAGAQPQIYSNPYNVNESIGLDPILSKQLLKFYGLEPRDHYYNVSRFMKRKIDSETDRHNSPLCKKKREDNESHGVYPGEDSILYSRYFNYPPIDEHPINEKKTTDTEEKAAYEKKIVELAKCINQIQKDVDLIKNGSQSNNLLLNDAKQPHECQQQSVIYTNPPQIIYNVSQPHPQVNLPVTGDIPNLPQLCPNSVISEENNTVDKTEEHAPKLSKTVPSKDLQPSTVIAASATDSKTQQKNVTKKLKNIFCTELNKK